jgi:hypothetical protein
LATICGLAFAGAVYGELVQPRLEWLHPGELVGSREASAHLLPGDLALARLLDAGVEVARASGLPGRLVLAEPTLFVLDLVAIPDSRESGISPERREFLATNTESAHAAGFTLPAAQVAGGWAGGPGWLAGASKVGRLARMTGARYFVSPAHAARGNQDNQENQPPGNQGNQNEGNQSNTGTGVLEVTVTPEPATVWLLAAGLISLALVGQRRGSRSIRR